METLAAKMASAAFIERVSIPLRLLSIRKKPAKPYKPCVEGRAHSIMEEPKISGFFFREAIVALPPMVTPIALPIQDTVNMTAIPT